MYTLEGYWAGTKVEQSSVGDINELEEVIESWQNRLNKKLIQFKWSKIETCHEVDILCIDVYQDDVRVNEINLRPE